MSKKLPSPKWKQIQKTMQIRANELKKKATLAEILLRSKLKENHIPHIFQSYRWKKGQLRIFDFVIKCNRRFAVEVDGGYHNPHKDAFKDKKFIAVRPSYEIIRFSNEQVLETPNWVISQIKGHIERRNSRGNLNGLG